jgi:DUF438 domain-containing protein
MNLVENFTSGQKDEKELWREYNRIISTKYVEAQGNTVGNLTMSGHLDSLKHDQKKLKTDKTSCYEQALRNFYLGLEGINTSVD